MNKLMRYLFSLRDIQRINLSLARASATAPLRQIDPTNPATWEFSGFSQHGEDGIIDYLTGRLKRPEGYFVEIGTGNGLENNSSWLAVAKYYSGLMIDGNQDNVDWCRYLLQPMNYGLDFNQAFVSRESIPRIIGMMVIKMPDLFSLDIDGNDYYICSELMRQGIRPKIWAVEYNSAYGPEKAITIKYQPDFRRANDGNGKLYYGCSIAGWVKLMGGYGYSFIGVDSCGVNAFFVNPDEFEQGFIKQIKATNFKENVSQMREFRKTWEGQFALIQNMEFENVL